jgi:RNA polymerase sigma factor (sigma-70 family)
MRTKEFTNFSDEQLTAKIISEGSVMLFEIIYTRYQNKVMDKCFTIVKNRALAKDLSEDILSKAYEKLGSFKGSASFGSWIYAITYNHCIDYLRLKNKMHYPDWNDEHQIPEIIDESEEDFSGLKSDRLNTMMEMLHTEEKALLLMKYQDDLSLRQISQALRLTDGAVKMRLKRAKARLLFLYMTHFGGNH